MRINKIVALHGYRTRHYSVGKPSVLIPNLVKRQFNVERPNRATIGDIGGGLGHLLQRVLERAPDARGVLFDLPQVIDNARPRAHPLIAYVGGRERTQAEWATMTRTRMRGDRGFMSTRSRRGACGRSACAAARLPWQRRSHSAALGGRRPCRLRRFHRVGNHFS